MVFFLELLPFIFMSLLVLFAIVYVLLQGVPQGILEVADLSVANIDYAVVFFLFLFLLFLWSFAFMIVTKYYLDCWIITDRRTIHTELRGFFSRFYSSVSHHNIQDVTVDVCGVLPTMMKYGNLKIQTAGAFRRFTFRQIPYPYETKKALLQASEEHRKKR